MARMDCGRPTHVRFDPTNNSTYDEYQRIQQDRRICNLSELRLFLGCHPRPQRRLIDTYAVLAVVVTIVLIMFIVLISLSKQR